MKQEELNEIVKRKKTNSSINLKGANLAGCYLRNADLRGMDLSKADLRGADLMDADLRGANLKRANLKGANLFGVNLENADLSEADLREAMLCLANLSGANLENADLSKTNLNKATLFRANLKEAKINYSNLSEADLSKANLIKTDFSNSDIQRTIFDESEEIRKGEILKTSIIGYKKCRNDIIVKLRIPRNAIVFSINNKSFRTNKCRVLDIFKYDEKKKIHKYKAISNYNKSFLYKLGRTIKVDDFNLMYNIESETGIHFFKTEKEAISDIISIND